MTEITARAHTLAAGISGGPTVVLIHGLESTWSSWLPIAVELDPNWRLVALELPWRPGNDYRWRHRNPGDWLGDSLEALDVRPDLLVAHSFGANATLELLCARDPRINSPVALICPLYRLPRHAVTWQMFDRARDLFFEHMRQGLRARLGLRSGTLDPDVLDVMVDVAIDRVGPMGFLTAFQQMAASTYLELGRIGTPTLLIAGGADPSLLPEAARRIAQSIPACDLVMTESHDHFCYVRHPAEVAAAVSAFAASAMIPTHPVRELQ
ncbi:alpha/beta hydrolase [Micromonospora sediminicola]|uniref:alpha/beta fold hydrolase n=1 Tax=Micromonospora sediminicola TaxID=946078 RepID=UPI0034087BF7